MTDTCTHCGETLHVGDWPYCPHGPVRNFTIQPDDFPGGRVFENIDRHPITVYSRSQLKRELDARGLKPMVRHIGENGTDKSKHTQRWV